MVEGGVPLIFEPDPLDRVVEGLLRDPQIRANLDEQHAQFERGELTVHTTKEVRQRLRKKGASHLDEPTTRS